MSSTTRGRIAAAALLAALLAGCGGVTRADTQAPPPPEVGVVTVAPGPVELVNELPGRVEASRVAEVRARTAGIVLERTFREGAEVAEGDVLFRIDPAPLQAARDAAAASLARAEASYKQAKLRAERIAPLVETHAVSQQDHDDAVAAHEAAAAEVAVAKASLQKAKLDLDYATVRAPIAGRIGRAEVTEGALVGQGQATPLATIQALDPVYVDLAQSSVELARLRRAVAGGELALAEDGALPVTVIGEDGQEHPYPGRLLFTDVTVDQGTGAVTLRAEVPNPDGALLPGMYVRARLVQGRIDEAIVVPQQAVLRDAKGASVRVVGAEGKIEVRPVEVGAPQGDGWVVRGLQAGDRVVVDGLQRARPGAPVTPVPWTPDGSLASGEAP